MSDAGKLVVLTTPGAQAALGVQAFPPAASNPAGPPTPADGDIYFNTSIGAWMFYDGSRSKWLSMETLNVAAGRNGNTSAGTFYRGIDRLVLDAGNRGIPCQKGTIVFLAIARTNAAAATLDVLNNGVVVASLAHAAAGATQTTSINVDISAGLLSFQNQAGGNTTSNVQVTLGYRRRP